MTNREILFRGKRVDNGEWVYGFYVERKSDSATYIVTSTIGASIYSEINNMTATAFRVIPETVGQYTGLKDKNGKRIFEGDILSINRHLQGIQIEFDNGCYIGVANNRKYKHRLEFDTPNIYEVIGNIYDNPELLGVVNNA